MRRQEGFTVAEMMVAVSIIGVLASIAIPSYKSFIEKARISQAHQGLKAMFTGEAALYSGRVGTRGINGSAPTPGNKVSYCQASCYGPSRNGNGWMDIPSGGEAVPWDFYDGYNNVGDHCKAIGFNLDAPTYFWFSSTNEVNGSTTCSGAGNWASFLRCAGDSPPAAGTCLYKNEAVYDFDADGLQTRYRQFVRANAKHELYRDGTGVTDGDMDDAF